MKSPEVINTRIQALIYLRNRATELQEDMPSPKIDELVEDIEDRIRVLEWVLK